MLDIVLIIRNFVVIMLDIVLIIRNFVVIMLEIVVIIRDFVVINRYLAVSFKNNMDLQPTGAQSPLYCERNLDLLEKLPR
jgi:hypothetical protein